MSDTTAILRSTLEGLRVKTPKAKDLPLMSADQERMRRWACKIAADLPSDRSDALHVLKLAERLILWTGNDEMLRPEDKPGAQ